jgi:hypothetical protein
MTLFDLLFVVLFIAGAGTLVVASVAALRGRRARALVLLRRLGVAAAVYFCMLLLVSALTPQRYLAIGDDQCSDDWCIAVEAVHRESTNLGLQYDVTFRLSSRARRVAQRERFVAVYLRGERGREYVPVTDAKAVPFDTQLQAGDTVSATRRFVVPADASIVGLVITRAGGGRFPACCIIADEASLLHRRTLVTLNRR